MAKKTEKRCGDCVSYLTDEDENGNVTDFHHDRNKESGFCAEHELFYTVQKNDRPCGNWSYDNEDAI